MNVKTLLFAGALFSVFAAGASAETADRTKPIEVNAHNFSGDEIKQAPSKSIRERLRFSATN